MAILAVGLVTLFQLFSGSLHAVKVSSDYTKAAIGAQKKMDEIVGLLYLEDFDELERHGEFGQGDEESSLAGYHWEINDEDYEVLELNERWERKHAHEERKFFLKKITVIVSWPSGGKNKQLEVVTLKMLYKENG